MESLPTLDVFFRMLNHIVSSSWTYHDNRIDELTEKELLDEEMYKHIKTVEVVHIQKVFLILYDLSDKRTQEEIKQLINKATKNVTNFFESETKPYDFDTVKKVLEQSFMIDYDTFSDESICYFSPFYEKMNTKTEEKACSLSIDLSFDEYKNSVRNLFKYLMDLEKSVIYDYDYYSFTKFDPSKSTEFEGFSADKRILLESKFGKQYHNILIIMEIFREIYDKNYRMFVNDKYLRSLISQYNVSIPDEKILELYDKNTKSREMLFYDVLSTIFEKIVDKNIKEYESSDKSMCLQHFIFSKNNITIDDHGLPKITNMYIKSRKHQKVYRLDDILKLI